MIPVELSRIVIRDNSDQQYIYVKELEGPRGFPIIIGNVFFGPGMCFTWSACSAIPVSPMAI